MKKMMMFVTLALIVTTASAFAEMNRLSIPDGMNITLICHTPGTFDGGYSVVMQSGGFVFHSSATVSEVTLYGSKEILNMPFLKETAEDGKVVYTDFVTNGQNFRLTYNSIRIDQNQEANSVLEAETSHGRIVENLVCNPVRHTM